MEGTNCNGEGGWTRVAFVNMSQPNATCPTGFRQFQQSGLTLCSRDGNNLVQSAVFTTLGLNYSAVCGRLRGYQRGTPLAFDNSISNTRLTIDDQYVAGVSITHGTNPRRHVWTYAIGDEEHETGINDCPCNSGNGISPPSFVGDQYYCESGTSDASSSLLKPNDLLWDGMSCNNLEAPCCANTMLPWFNITLSETTNDDLELRLMFGGPSNIVDGPLDLIELYIR